MWTKEYIRYLKSKKSFIIIALVFVNLASFLISLSEKNMFITQMASDSPDLNKTALSELIAEYTGFRFTFNFWFVSDFFLIYLVILFLWVGVFLSCAVEKDRESGLGNLLVTRRTYAYYLRCVLMAQSLYISTVVFVSAIISLILAFCIGGFSFRQISIGSYYLNPGQTILVFFLQVLLIVLITILINGICMLSNIMIKNKYILQSLPMIAFSLAPMLLASTVGNLYQPFGEFLICFIPWNELRSIDYIFQAHFSLESFVLCLFPIVVYGILLGGLYYVNKKHFSENYL